MTNPRILVLAGRGRYEDPFHDHAATSHRVAQVLAGLDAQVVVRSTFPDAFGDLASFDLLVVNSGNGRVDPDFDGDDERWAPAHRALQEVAAAGTPVLGLHQAAGTFADSPSWAAILGGRWVPGTSMHPPIGEAAFEVRSDHPVVAGLGQVTAFDERYSYLEVHPQSQVLLTHRHDDVEHPVAWLSTEGGYRCGYDALGHGVESYDSPERRRLLLREAAWLLGRDPCP